MPLDSQAIADLLLRYTAAVCETPMSPGAQAFPRYADRLVRCLTHHATALFRDGARVAASVLDYVRAHPAPRGAGDQTTVDLIADVVLAQACLENEGPARRAFLLAYQGRLEGGARRRFGRVVGREFDQEMGDVWSLFAEPRPRSGPRLDEFWGRTPLWAFLWLSLTRCYLDWRRRVQAEPRPVPEPAISGHPALEAQVREECAARLCEAFAQAAARLAPEDRLLVWWVDCEGRSQSALAKVLRLDPGHVSRKHKVAVARLRESALGYLRETHGEAACDECLEEFAAAHAALQARLGLELAEWSRRVGADAPASLGLRLT